jgi:hypothetical protein
MPDRLPPLAAADATPQERSATTVCLSPEAEVRPPVSHEVDESTGTHIGRYLVERLLGEGGFGRVFLATDPDLHRPLAIKVPRSASEWSASRAASFLTEARLAARLKHPHVVTIHDIGPAPEYGVFVAMEYVDGTALSERLKHGPLPVAEAVRIVTQVADAVHHAHKCGVVHRDLKPANILLEKSGDAKVADFGLAITEDQQAARRGEISGSPMYMAPEQFRGEVHHFDGRTDIWSLGVVLYECLTGKRPFTGTDRGEVREQVLLRAPKPPRQIDDAIPAAVEEVCLACLEKDPADRPKTAGDVAAALRRALAPAEKPPARTAPAALTVAAVALVALAAVAIHSWNTRNEARADRAAAPVLPAPAAPILPPRTSPLATLEPLVFDRRHPDNAFSYLPAEDRLFVNTNSLAIFIARDPHPQSFRLRLETAKRHQLGECGVVWNCRPTNIEDSSPLSRVPNINSAYSFLTVIAQQSSKDDVARLFLLNWTVAGSPPFHMDSGTKKVVERVEMPLDLEQPITFDLRVVGGRVEALRFQDAEVPFERLEKVTFEPTDQGPVCGFLCMPGHYVVTRFIVTEE